MLKGPNQLDERVPVEVDTNIRSTTVRIHSTRLPGSPTRLASMTLTASSCRFEGSLGCRWVGYGLYRPVTAGKLLDIFRVFYNLVEVGRNKQTPAMRLGPAKGKITVENIIYYR